MADSDEKIDQLAQSADTPKKAYVAKDTAMGVLGFKNRTFHNTNTGQDETLSQLVFAGFNGDGPEATATIKMSDFKNREELNLGNTKNQELVTSIIAGIINNEQKTVNQEDKVKQLNIESAIKQNNATFPEAEPYISKYNSTGLGDTTRNGNEGETFLVGGDYKQPVTTPSPIPSSINEQAPFSGRRKSVKRRHFKRAKSSKMRGGKRRTPRNLKK